uniref:hypothetical protein n=1 Tax=Streptomyces chartreusis TaxID=1969 RepID=UPI003F496E1A
MRAHQIAVSTGRDSDDVVTRRGWRDTLSVLDEGADRTAQLVEDAQVNGWWSEVEGLEGLKFAVW